jgi:hypothetical protein
LKADPSFASDPDDSLEKRVDAARFSTHSTHAQALDEIGHQDVEARLAGQ